MQSIECIVHKSNTKISPFKDIGIDKRVENYRLELLAVLKGDNIISLTSAKRRKNELYNKGEVKE